MANKNNNDIADDLEPTEIDNKSMTTNTVNFFTMYNNMINNALTSDNNHSMISNCILSTVFSTKNMIHTTIQERSN